MEVIPGRLAMVQRGDSRPYAEGVHFLARIVRDLLTFEFFRRRIGEQMEREELVGLDYEQARYSRIACFDAIAVNTIKLTEKNRKTWNFEQLFNEWRRYIHDEAEQRAVMSAVDNLRRKVAWVEVYRHNEMAHQTKDEETTTFTMLPDKVDFLGELVGVMDMFVEGKIQYPLHLHESNEEIDLRKELGLET